MNPKNITSVIDRAMSTYTAMGMRCDEPRRQLLRETVALHVDAQIQLGELDADRLVVTVLTHLVALENREPVRTADGRKDWRRSPDYP